MNKEDLTVLGTLILLAVFIWLRDLNWMTESADTLPIIIALPLFAWLGAPWLWKKDNPDILPLPRVILITLLFAVGIVTNLTILLTISWILLLWTWLAMRTEEATHSTTLKLLILPLMAFPWVCLDAQPLGWFFRLSGAWSVAHIFASLGLEVSQNGTELLVNNLPISIEAACGGLNTLQSMIIVGSMLAFIYLGDSPRYWWNLPVLPLLAWIANTARILVLTAAAVVVNPAFALGIFHTWGGWFVIFMMLCLSWLIFSLQEKKAENRNENT